MARLVAERRVIVPMLAEIFRRHGYEGASIARISAHTGLGKGSLYHFFSGGKAEMANAVLAEIRSWFDARIFDPLEQAAPDVAIPAMFTGVAEYFASGQRICLVGAFALDEGRERFAVPIAGYFGQWRKALSTAMQRAGRAAADADMRADQAIAGIQGAIILSRAMADDRIFADAMAALTALCMHD